MKLRFALYFIIAVTEILAFNSCTTSGSLESNSSTSVANTISTIIATTTEEEKVIINIDYAEDEILSKYNSFDNYIDVENRERIVFWVNTLVRDFRFLEVDVEDSNNIKSKVLYFINDLSPEKPLVVQTIVSEGFVTRGISYMDEENIERYFYIEYSGIGNGNPSLSLIEFVSIQS